MNPNASQHIVGVDIGGTFTDAVVLSENGKMTIGKALSTPDDFALGAIDAVRDAARNLGLADEDELLRSTRLFFHACTIGENTVITRAGAKTGLITVSPTFCSQRGRITDGLMEERHLPAALEDRSLCPRRRIEEARERIDYKGEA
jgi:N-methylhydantoinase A